MDDNSYLSRKQAAQFLANLGCPLAPTTLERWARDDKGPPFVKYGNIIRYRAGDLNAWAERNRVRGGEDLGVPLARGL